MSEELEAEISAKLDRFAKLFPIAWALGVAAAGGIVWGTTLQLKIDQMEVKAGQIETRATANESRTEARLTRIEFYVLRIAEKVGVQVEPPSRN